MLPNGQRNRIDQQATCRHTADAQRVPGGHLYCGRLRIGLSTEFGARPFPLSFSSSSCRRHRRIRRDSGSLRGPAAIQFRWRRACLGRVPSGRLRAGLIRSQTPAECVYELRLWRPTQTLNVLVLYDRFWN